MLVTERMKSGVLRFSPNSVYCLSIANLEYSYHKKPNRVNINFLFPRLQRRTLTARYPEAFFSD